MALRTPACRGNRPRVVSPLRMCAPPSRWAASAPPPAARRSPRPPAR
eukprot:ctg_166.g89